MKRLLILVFLTAGVLLSPAIATAHPLGNFTVNHYARAELSGGNLYLRYVLDMAEIPTLRERARIDAAGGLASYAARRAPELGRDLQITIDGRRLPLVPVSQTASFHPGAAGLKILRFAAWYRTPDAMGIARSPHRVALRDATYPGRLGWKEVVVRATSGAKLADSTAPVDDTSDELRSYPQNLLSSPLNVETANFTWTPSTGPGLVGPETQDPESRVTDRNKGGLVGLVEGRLSVGVVILALLLAMGWGALHALSPGHGKSMVAAYLVGTRGTARHAFTLGLFVTITHTISVVLFGVATLWLSAYILPEVLFRWLSLIAGLMVVAIGGWVLWRRARHLRGRRAPGRVSAALPRFASPAYSAVGSSVAGMEVVPDRFRHNHAEHVHEHGPNELHGPGGSHHHAHKGAAGHSHAAPDELSFRNLAIAGFSAGLLPCPSAMVLLLGAIALGRVGYGLILVAAFSVGLAGLLSLIGLLVLYARRFVERLPLDGRLAAAVPVASALIILALGIVLTAKALPGVV